VRGWFPVLLPEAALTAAEPSVVGVVVAVIFHCFSFVCPVGRFFLSVQSEAKEKRTTGRQRGTKEGEGEGPRAGRASPKRLIVGAQPCCPEGPSEAVTLARGSGEGTRGQAHRAVGFALQNQQMERQKTARQICLLKLMGIKHTAGTTGSLKGGSVALAD